MTEGKVTEIEYLEQLGQALPRTAATFTVRGDGTDPLRVVKRAFKERKRHDHDWVVCLVDCDDHTTLEKAFALARSEGIEVLVSNPCFLRGDVGAESPPQGVGSVTVGSRPSPEPRSPMLTKPQRISCTRQRFVASVPLATAALIVPGVTDAALADETTPDGRGGRGRSQLGVQWSGSALHVRTPGWDSSHDAVQRWVVGHKGHFVSPDDFWAGNGFLCRQLTVPGHGLVFGDVGRVFVDGASQEYVLADIADANTLDLPCRVSHDINPVGSVTIHLEDTFHVASRVTLHAAQPQRSFSPAPTRVTAGGWGRLRRSCGRDRQHEDAHLHPRHLGRQQPAPKCVGMSVFVDGRLSRRVASSPVRSASTAGSRTPPP